MRTRIAGAFYAVNSFVSLALGAIYIFRESFMPYHGEALQLQWAELDPSFQVLLLALMDVAGAGWITLGVVILVLLIGPFRAGERWARYLIPAAILLFYVPTFLATLSVTQATPATAPWYGNAIAIATAVIGFIIDAPWAKRR
ncbi:MAG: hypothetical protein AAFW81_00205 [Pseudomonadota bacterium]